MDKAGARREEILERLEAEGGVTPDTVRKIAIETGVPEADVWGAGKFYSLIREPGSRVRVCTGLSCRLAGAADRIDALERSGQPREEVSCIGQCDRAPAALDPDLELIPGEGTASAVLPDDPALPVNLGGADAADYAALTKVRAWGAEAVLDAIETSGLQGRGGAGFPAHIKWRAVGGQTETERYVVCNADEGEPGTFKDREIMQRRPHQMLEGLAIAAATVGASEIIIYIRGEFRDARRALEAALREAGDHLQPFTIRFASGHGAYICGEETALLESLEGKRGMPRLKPPFPTECGFRGKPTLMHNVETAACVPAIVHRGGRRFHDLGRTERRHQAVLRVRSREPARCLRTPPGRDAGRAGGDRRRLRRHAAGVQSRRCVVRVPAHEPARPAAGFPQPGQGRLDAGQRRGGGAERHRGHGAGGGLADPVLRATRAAASARRAASGPGTCATPAGRFLEDGDPEALLNADDVGWEMEEGSICGLGMVAAKPLDIGDEAFSGGVHARRR